MDYGSDRWVSEVGRWKGLWRFDRASTTGYALRPYSTSSAVSLVTVLIKSSFNFIARITSHLYQHTIPLEIKLSDVTSQLPVIDGSLFSAIDFLLTFFRASTIGHISHHWHNINIYPPEKPVLCHAVLGSPG